MTVVDDHFVVAAGTRRDLDVRGNDIDRDGRLANVASYTDPVRGLLPGVAGCLVNCDYTAPTELGPDSFTYTIEDGEGGSATATVTIDVVAKNPAIAVDDRFVLAVGTSARLRSSTLDILRNDFDPYRGFGISAPNLPIDSTTTPDRGRIESGRYIAPDTPGTDRFEYTIVDEAGHPSTATVSIDVVDTLPDPVVVDDRFVVAAGFNRTGGIRKTLNLRANDNDPGETLPPVIASFSPPTNGLIIDRCNSVCGYRTPPVPVDDSFSYIGEDADGNSAEATVDVEMVPGLAPVASDAIFVVAPGSGEAILDVTYNDDDPDYLLPAAIASFTEPTNGGSVRRCTSFVCAYTPPATGGIVDTFTYTVDDEGGGVATAKVTVIVPDEPNQLPVAIARVDGLAAEGSTVQLDGTRSNDPDGSIVSYAWTPADRLDGADTATPSFDAPDDEVLTVTLTVTDDRGATDTNTLNVRVLNLPPVVDVGGNQEGLTTDTFTVPVDIVDPGPLDMHSISIDWGDGTSSTTTSHRYSAAGVYEVRVVVRDNGGAVDIADLTITVTDPAPTNVPPTADAGNDLSVDEGSTVQLDGSASADSDGTVVSYSWSPTDNLDDPTSATPAFTGVDDATVELTLTVTDDDGATSTDEVTVRVRNVRPTVSAGPNQTGTVGDAFFVEAEISDPGTLDTHTTAINWGDGSGESPSPHVFDRPGRFTVTVTVTDDDGGTGRDVVEISVSPEDEPVNQLPTADAGPDVEVDEGSIIQLDGTGSSDPDGRIVEYRWLPLVDLSGNSSATPTFEAIDDVVRDYTLRVTDDRDGHDSDSVRVTVNNVAPTVDAGDDLLVELGQRVALRPRIDDPGTRDTHTTAFDWGDGEVSRTGGHTYASPGEFTVTVTVTDDDGGVGTDTIVVTVSEPPPPQAKAALVVACCSSPFRNDRPYGVNLERLGYEVTYQDVRTLETADADGYDVVVVSSSVKPWILGDTLKNSRADILIAEGWVYDDMGMSTDAKRTEGETRRAMRMRVVGDHPIAAGLAGVQRVATHGTPFNFGVVGGDAVVVATENGGAERPVIFAYEAGSALADETAAAGRRVGFHMSWPTPRRTNAVGWSIFDAAITWLDG